MKTFKYISILALAIFSITSCTKDIDVVETETDTTESQFNLEVDSRSVLSGEALGFFCDSLFVEGNDESISLSVAIVTNSQNFIEEYNGFSGNVDDFDFDYQNLELGDFMMGTFFLVDNINGLIGEFSVFDAKLDLGDGPKLYTSDSESTEATYSTLSTDNITGSFSGNLYDDNGNVIGDFEGEFNTDDVRLDICD